MKVTTWWWRPWCPCRIPESQFGVWDFPRFYFGLVLVAKRGVGSLSSSSLPSLCHRGGVAQRPVALVGEVRWEARGREAVSAEAGERRSWRREELHRHGTLCDGRRYACACSKQECAVHSSRDPCVSCVAS